MISTIKSKLTERFRALNDEATVAEFKAGHEAERNDGKINRLEKKAKKTAEEEATLRQLKKENERIRENQRAAANIMQRTSLAEKILKCYFAYKMTKLLLTPLIALATPTYGANYQMGHAITDGLNTAAEHEAEAMMEGKEPDGEDRAKVIEEVQKSFQDISDEAQRQGLTETPVFTDEDKAKLDDLAAISRDTDNPQQMEQYAAKCQELGLDYDKAREAFAQDKTFDDVSRDVAADEKAKAQEAGYEIEM